MRGPPFRPSLFLFALLPCTPATASRNLPFQGCMDGMGDMNWKDWEKSAGQGPFDVRAADDVDGYVWLVAPMLACFVGRLVMWSG